MRSPDSLWQRRGAAGLVLFTVFAVLLALPGGALASLSSSLRHQMRAAGHYSGAYVADANTGRRLFSWRSTAPRIPASNVKLFTTAAALDRFGIDGTLETEVLSDVAPNEDGVLAGDLWLRGGGDPAFGSLAYVRRHYGPEASSLEHLVDQLAEAGLTAVRGGVHADESAFDAIRGVHDSRYYTSPWIGPLSALAFNHGYDSNGFQSNPAKYAVARLRRTLKADGIAPGHAAAVSEAPDDAQVLATVPSPPMATLVALTNKDSDNFFAETLLKAVGRDRYGLGSTANGVRAVRVFARHAGARVSFIDGSGLDHGNRVSPRDVVRFLIAQRAEPEFQALYDSLPVAGEDGSLDDRMRRGPAHTRCHAKTGTLTGVSALSGFCTTRSGREIAFSFLMNGLSATYARRLQDRMAQKIAGWRG